MLDRARQVLRDLHDAARLGPLAVRAHAEKVDAQREIDRAHQVGREDEAPFEDADEDERAILVVLRDLRAELVHAGGDLLLAESIVTKRSVMHPLRSSTTRRQRPHGRKRRPGCDRRSSR